MTELQMLRLLRKEIRNAGSLRQWATDNGISAPYVSRVLAGIKAVGDTIPAALGLEKITAYRRIKK